MKDANIRGNVYAVKKEKIYPLDLLRVIIAFSVFLFHSNCHMGLTFNFFTSFISQGAIFMVAFFILSGFSLYYNYYDKDLLNSKKNLKVFYMKRFATIYPLYVAIYILWLLVFNNLTLQQNLIIAPIELLLLQSFFSSLFGILHNGGTWFVSCICFCYFLFPFINNILIQIKKYRKLLLISLVLLCCYAPFVVTTFQLNEIYSSPFFRLLEFVIGMIVGSFFVDSKDTKSKNFFYILLESLILFSGITILVLNQIYPNNYPAFNFLSIPLFSFIIYQLSKIKTPFIIKICRNRFIQYLSAISYAFFFAQFFTWSLTGYLKEHFSWFETHTNIKLFAASLLICIIISILMHEIIEKPAKKLIKKLVSL